MRRPFLMMISSWPSISTVTRLLCYSFSRGPSGLVTSLRGVGAGQVPREQADFAMQVQILGQRKSVRTRGWQVSLAIE